MSIFATINLISSELLSQAIRAATGKLFTEEQIRKITNHSVGKYLADYFPEDERESTQRERIAEAQSHIVQASMIMADMRVELDAQKETLETLLAEIDEKKSKAKRYAELAETNQDAVSAMRFEIEGALRDELDRQSKEGRGVRRTASAVLWLFTLISGAVLGTYFRDIVVYLASLF